MTDLLGSTIREYQLVQLIVESERAAVYKAYQPRMDRYVLLTLLKPRIAHDPSSVEIFLQASKVASQMQHKNIIPVYDFGQEEDKVYRVYPFIETGTVQENLGWFLPLENTLMLIGQITAGLEYIYAQGYIHDNLRSSNIFLDAMQQPLLSGFGIPHPPGEYEDPYLSPEQIQGGMVDKRTDVYSLGVLLFELLTGNLPQAGLAINLRAKRPDLSEAVERVVLKAMAQNPDQRFQDPVELKNALQQAVQSLLSQVAPVPVSTPPPAPVVSQTVHVEQSKSTNWAVIILSVVLILVCLGGAFLVIPPLLQKDEISLTPTQPPVEKPPVEQPPVEEPTQPPVAEQPVEEPGQLPVEHPPSNSGGQPNICGSIAIVGGFACVSVVMANTKRKAFRIEKCVSKSPDF